MTSFDMSRAESAARPTLTQNTQMGIVSASIVALIQTVQGWALCGLLLLHGERLWT